MQYSINQNEIKRRRKAFVSLCLFFCLGLLFVQLFVKVEIFSSLFIIFASALVIFIIMTFVYLSVYSQNKLIINEMNIALANGKNSASLCFKDIIRLKIKRRTNGVIREIYMWTQSGKALYINAFENDFEIIEKEIKKFIPGNTKIEEEREFINLDHFLFYPIFGLIIGLISMFSLTALSGLSEGKTVLLFWAISIYAFALGWYFAIKKPLSLRSAKNTAKSDYFFAALLIIISVIIAIVISRKML